MEKHQKPSPKRPSSEELILVDDDLILQYQENNQDLYDELIKEPAFVKQQSIKYDYRPNFNAFLSYDQNNVSQGTYQGHQELSDPEKPSKMVSQSSKQSSEKSDKSVKCRCSKTKCQKNYCDCFRAGQACNQQCECSGCGNDAHHHQILKLKKKQAPGCKCKKSKCLKNYCECHSAGKKCSPECICQDCQNMEDEFERFPESQPRKLVKICRELPVLMLEKRESSRLFSDLY